MNAVQTGHVQEAAPELPGPRGLEERSSHPLPQPLGLCTLGFQLLPPLRRGCVGLSQGARQLVVAVLQREELGLPLYLAHRAAGTQGSASVRLRGGATLGEGRGQEAVLG